MALVTISGFPCSSKTKRALQLKQFIEEKLSEPSYDGPKPKVVIISDDNLNIDRSVYNDSKSEKIARGKLFAALQRELSVDKIVILDGLNYIKGFRYQLYCAAREAKVRVCTIFTAITPEVCRAWNQSCNHYPPETLDALTMRFEEPNSMVRWDAPLFTILWNEETIPSDGIWDAIMKGAIKPPNVGALNVSKSPTDALHVLEQTATTLVTSILSSPSVSLGTGGPTPLKIGDTAVTLELPARSITMSELQRLKRSFVVVHKKAITLGTTEKGSVDWSQEKVAEKFVTYLQEHLL
ncbi:hypothetical protein AX16_006927 [Volvariella volvacea WC 439]|nr:hypothetical protein AX16_006927 [Volvariella volvacea WC 439]